MRFAIAGIALQKQRAPQLELRGDLECNGIAIGSLRSIKGIRAVASRAGAFALPSLPEMLNASLVTGSSLDETITGVVQIERAAPLALKSGCATARAER